MTKFNGKIAVITGAGSGMGRDLALQLADKGAKLAVTDVNPTGLEETVRLLEAKGAEVHSQLLNVAEREAVLDYADAVIERFGKVHVIFNNAGIAHHGEVELTDFKTYERIMDVDYWGVVNCTKAFLPFMQKAGEGHIVNTSSLFGLMAIPGQSAYNAAKFAVRGFTESLRQEMLIAGGKIKVSCVHPGGIKTAIARNSTAAEGMDQSTLAEFFDTKLARTSSPKAAEIILRGVEKNRGRILVGPDAVFLDLYVRALGGTYARIVAGTTKRFLPKA